MMWIMWSKISYIVQILAACCIFLIPAKKKKNFPIRVLVSGLALIIGAYILSFYHETTDPGNLALQFWAIYIFSAVAFVWFNMQCTFLEAVYCGICSCGLQHISFDFYMIIQQLSGEQSTNPSILYSMIFLLIYVGIYIFGYLFLSRKLVEGGRYVVKSDAAIPLITMILLIWVISIIELSPLNGFEAGIYNHIIYRIMDALCCFYVLWVQINQKEKMHLQRELDGINAVVRQQQNQYRMTSDTIDSINRRCHDLKHQIRTLRSQTNEKEIREYLNEIENDVMIYDTALMTGNKALDTVLMEKGLFCKDHNIQWSCMADGTKLDFMKIEDIYAIFGNALDNAVTAVLALKDEEKKVISVKILEQNQLLMIQIQNYYENHLKFERGLPLTTKKNKNHHGFGMKSIQYIAEKYDGIVTVQAKNNIFMLQILIPVVL